MLESYRLIWAILTPPERQRFVLLMFLTGIMAVFEMLGVAIILPLLSVLTNPEIISTNPNLIRFSNLTGLQSETEVTIGLGILALIVILLSMVIRSFTTYVQIRFCLMRTYSISMRMLKGWLTQDYAWFLSRNSAELGQVVLSEVDIVVNKGLLPAVLLISNIFITISITVFIFLAEPFVAIGVISVLGTVYVGIYLLLRRPLLMASKNRVAANKIKVQTMQEATGGIKEIKAIGLEDYATRRFQASAIDVARYHTRSLVFARLPRYALEAVIYTGFISTILYTIIWREDGLAQMAPVFALLGMASLKLFPALQQSYQEASRLAFSAPVLAKLLQNLSSFAPPTQTEDGPRLPLARALDLRAVDYNYPNAERTTLQGLSATIPAGSRVGIVGGTGAGKTTVVDLVLGLLHPNSGQIMIDDIVLRPDNIRRWQKNIGYVPQAIFLIDDTIAANIAFGYSAGQVDMARVEHVARIARLHDFVITDLPDGYATRVGERGVRLSGGQRQRIGIARALYHDPDLLILDEATSALDNVTEREVMEAVYALGRDKTVLMIAHRLSTVENCDTILLLEQGKLAASGSYNELLETNESFRRMAKG